MMLCNMQKKKIPGLLLLVDFEKVSWDTVSWDLLKKFLNITISEQI